MAEPSILSKLQHWRKISIPISLGMLALNITGLIVGFPLTLMICMSVALASSILFVIATFLPDRLLKKPHSYIQ